MERFWKKKEEKNLMLSASQLRESQDRGKERDVIEDQYGSLSRLFSSARKSKSLTVEELSTLSGVGVDDIVDLECGSHRLPQAVRVAENLRETVDIDVRKYAVVLFKITSRL